ncbi:dual specificity mitogen-activated protein kinase kinase hemipterous-like [Anopheles cruzii]|uniref:dual specificity mitogen-activated protein kinase kinase hemipterous-like n=1 Tax=Anopheles cruzii TaxID=68878 RepID=UPI0022EC8F50|nr:dual specificity mitogen-activated protein kinase kinase hemipterous-like [Anopheles cruzii]
MQPTEKHPGAPPSDNNGSEDSDTAAGDKQRTKNGTMSIDNRITEIENSIRNPRRPTPPSMTFPAQSTTGRPNRVGGVMGGGPGPNRPVVLSLPVMEQRRSESELKFQKIVDKSGLLKINNQIYRTPQSELEDLGELGNGTSGHVVKMRHNPSGAIIAVKQMRRTGNDEENKRIIMDLDVVLKSENCKYIVKCLGCFISDADVWICMELMTTCFDKLQKKSSKPVPEEILGKVTVATVRALAYLKDNHRVIHRDVKPSNILIDDRGNIKLCDFGISGRLVDSNARTRSAGCAAYMAPERIDPSNTVYDIRADVWSLGITLVELATGVFPYRGCVNDFEVLTQVLTSNPPRLPEDQHFSVEFRDFVQRCLQKDYLARPKYPDLLRHAFLQRAEHDTTINVGEWFRNVAVNCGIQLTSPPQPAAGATAAIAAASGVSLAGACAASSEQTRIPTPLGSLTEAVQAQSNQQKQTIAIAASSIPIKSGANCSTNSSSSPFIMANSSAPHIIAANNNNHNNSMEPNNLSHRPQISAEHHLHQQLHQQQQQQMIQSKLSTISLATPTATVGAPQPHATTTSSSSPVFDPRRTPSPQAPYLSKLQPKSAITSTSVPIVADRNGGSLGPDHHHQQQQQLHHHPLPRKYKHSPFLSRRPGGGSSGGGTAEYGSGSPKKESSLSSLGQSIFKNLTTSPFSSRKTMPAGGDPKLTIVSPPPPPMYGDVTGATYQNAFAHTNGSGGPALGNPSSSSPLILLRKAHEPSPAHDDTQYKHLQGNTSPIVLQRFYHQQNQLLEQQREALHQQQTAIYVSHGYVTTATGSGSAIDGSPRMIRYSPLPAHRTVHHGVHPVLSATPPSNHLYDASPLPPSGIPVYQQQHPCAATNSPKHRAPSTSSSSTFFSTFSRGMKGAGRCDKVIDRSGASGGTTVMLNMSGSSPAAERSLYGTTTTSTMAQPLYHDRQPSAFGRHGNPTATGSTVDGGGIKDETGWFNSIADLAKRRFASFVKLNLSNNGNGGGGGAGTGGPSSSGDKRTLKEKHLFQQQYTPYPQPAFESPASTVPSAIGGGYVVQPPSAIPSTIGHTVPMGSHVLNSAAADRRHRSPDPPPRFNRGQSPLLLQRKLEQLGHTGSPLLNRRPFTSASPSPPLPPRRGSESVPGSPQHLRTRINYTPEPHRRPYRTTTIDQ